MRTRKMLDSSPTMAQATHSQALSAALLHLLRPLVRILLRNTISHRTFADLAKQVYVDVANAEFAIHGKKQTVSRIAILTGLTRKDVQRLLKRSASSKSMTSVSAEEYHRGSRVITGWLRDPKYGDGRGHPRPLAMDGGSASFSALVNSYSGDMPVRAVLDELLRVGAVRQLKDGRICLVSRGYIPQKGSMEKLQVLGADTADLISTLDYNIYVKPTKPRFQRKVMYDNVPREAAKEFRTVVAAEGQEFLEKLDRWLAHHDRDVNPASKGTGRVRVGLGVFQFEEQEPPGDSNREDPSS